MARYTRDQVAGVIDHSLLHPALADAEMEIGCFDAKEWRVASVCVKPHFAARARAILEGSGVRTGATVGFPHGGHAISVKVAEARTALGQGAEELDMVINIGKVKGAEWGYLRDEVGAVLDATHAEGGLLKVILENCYLVEEEKRQLCRLCRELGADFVKTSTGFGTGGATIDDVRLMLQEAGSVMGVKAAGGLRTCAAVVDMMAMGVRRVGASQTGKILEECERQA